VLHEAASCTPGGRFWEKILPALNTRTASTILAQLTDRSGTAPGPHWRFPPLSLCVETRTR
jgi:hypothetical protein